MSGASTEGTASGASTEGTASSASTEETVSGAPPPPTPLLRVVRGEPTPAELAALVAVLAARSGGGDLEPEPASAWTDRATGFRPVLRPAPGAWRWSSFGTGHRTRADW